MTGSRVSKAVVLALALTIACALPEFDRDSAKKLIQESAAFQGPWDPGMRIDGRKLSADPTWHREVLTVTGIEVRGTGLSAIANVGFTWRWNAGPFGGSILQSTALFLYVGKWRLQERKLQNDLWRQERNSE